MSHHPILSPAGLSRPLPNLLFRPPIDYSSQLKTERYNDPSPIHFTYFYQPPISKSSRSTVFNVILSVNVVLSYCSAWFRFATLSSAIIATYNRHITVKYWVLPHETGFCCRIFCIIGCTPVIDVTRIMKIYPIFDWSFKKAIFIETNISDHRVICDSYHNTPVK